MALPLLHKPTYVSPFLFAQLAQMNPTSNFCVEKQYIVPVCPSVHHTGGSVKDG